MSFILDALKKSESERQRQAGPALLEMRIVRPTRQLPVWVMVVGAILIISVAALAWMVLRPGSVPATAAVPAAAPVAAAVGNAQAAGAPPNATAPASTAASVQGPRSVAPLAVNAATATAPALAQQPAEPASDSNPADTEPAVAPPAGTARETSASNLRNYTELGGSLPELRLDLHVYASNPAERYAFINMHKVREGDVTPEGVQVKEITRDGVVLDYRGTEFILGHQ
jgi:general secretion pathway protein B